MLRPVPKAKHNTAQTMTVMQVASALQISRSKAYEIVRSDGFPKIRLGRRMLIPKEAFQEWLEQNTTLSYRECTNGTAV